MREILANVDGFVIMRPSGSLRIATWPLGELRAISSRTRTKVAPSSGGGGIRGHEVWWLATRADLKVDETADGRLGAHRLHPGHRRFGHCFVSHAIVFRFLETLSNAKGWPGRVSRAAPRERLPKTDCGQRMYATCDGKRFICFSKHKRRFSYCAGFFRTRDRGSSGAAKVRLAHPSKLQMHATRATMVTGF